MNESRLIKIKWLLVDPLKGEGISPSLFCINCVPLRWEVKAGTVRWRLRANHLSHLKVKVGMSNLVQPCKGPLQKYLQVGI